MNNKEEYLRFLDNFIDMKSLTKWQRMLLQIDRIKNYKEIKRSSQIYKYSKLAVNITNALLKENTNIAIVNANDKEGIKITEIEDMLKNREIEYITDNNKIVFVNGSVIEILKPNNESENIRGHRRNLPLYYDFNYDKEKVDKVLDEFIKK